MKNVLINKTIKEMKIADDNRALLFITDSGDILVKVDGDCCSSTWIESIELPALGFPSKVLSVEDLNMPEDEKNDEYEVIAFYGCKISTDHGDIIIDYRNSSNGYYGGNLSWPNDSYYYGGVYGQNISTLIWKDIKE